MVLAYSQLPSSDVALESKLHAASSMHPGVAFNKVNENDINKYKEFESISEIILFDSKGYEKSIEFDHKLLNNVSTSVNKMLAGNIQYDDNLDKYSKIADIIDISGSLETSGEKDISKIRIFLENISKIKNEN